MKIALFANTDWFLYNFRRGLARSLVENGCEVLLISPPGPYGKKLQDLGFRWEPVPLERRSLNPFKEFYFIFWLYKFLKREKVDLLHSFTIKSVVYGAVAGQLARVKSRVNGIDGLGYVFSSNDLKALFLRPFVKGLIKFSCRGENTRVVLLNRDDVENFAKSGLAKASQIRLIQGAGVDLGRFSAQVCQPRGNTKRVLLAARLLWDKGIGEYVDAARELRRRGANIEFLLAGNPDPGNPAAIDEGVVRGWVDEGVINWLGHVEDMPSLLRTVDIVVLPSYREGLPTTLIEAAACGLPIITTNVPGCRDVVDDQINGLLVPFKNSTFLADAIFTLYSNNSFSNTLGENARLKVLSSFDEKIIIRDTFRVYGELYAEKNFDQTNFLSG